MRARSSTRTVDARSGPGRARARMLGLITAATVAAGLAACSGDEPLSAPPRTDGASGVETTTPAGPSEPSTEPTVAPPAPDDSSTADAPAFPADTAPDTADPSQDAMLTVTDVRIGRHEGFDRVVYELGGTGTPGWTVQYVDEAVQDGSGEVIDLAGDGTLQVLISGSAYPMDSGAQPFEHDGPVTGEGTVTVTEARGWSVFEGITDAFVGLQSPGHRFRVYLLEAPVRVVIDIADEPLF